MGTLKAEVNSELLRQSLAVLCRRRPVDREAPTVLATVSLEAQEACRPPGGLWV